MLVAAPAASAQLSAFQPVPVPDDPEVVDVSNDASYSVQEFIRSDQQPLSFDIGTGPLVSFYVSLDGGLNQQLTTFIDDNPAWTNPPSSIGSYAVEIGYATTNRTKTYSFELIVMPGATRAFTAQESLPDTTLTHTVLVWSEADGGGTFDKPLLVVEGIDAANINNPASYYALGIRQNADLFGPAQAEGADIAILDFGDGGRELQPNAAVVRRALLDLPANNQSPTDELDVAGVSMGGVVARYALAKMEEDAEDHRVKTFVSMDAPQQGAVVDEALQIFIRNEVDDPDEWPASLARPAGWQLLKANWFDPVTPPQGQPNAHEAFYAELGALNGGTGYPQQTQNVGVSFGTTAPNPYANELWLNVDVDPNVFEAGEEDFFITGDLAGPGSRLPLKQTQFRGYADAAAGFVSYELERYDDPTFIPYNSALDIQPDGSSPFDPPLLDAAADGATYHDDIPPSIIVPLLNRLGYGLPPPPSVSVSGPATLDANEDGTWRASTPDANATYTYTWEWRARQRSSGGGGSGPITNYVPYDQWHTAPTAGPVFTHSFPCGVWGDVRVTATGSGASVQSNERRTYVAACSGGGKGGGAFAEGDTASKAGAASGDALSLSAAFPNPALTDVRFQVTVAEPATFAVYDALGRTVDTRRVDHSGSVSIELGAYAPGLYVARLSTDTEMELSTDTEMETHRFSVSR